MRVAASKVNRSERDSLVTSMRAVRIHSYGDPDVLTCDTVGVPRAEEGNVLVRVQYAAVNGADLNLRAGRHTVQRHGLSHHPVSVASQLPVTLGMEVCGEVAAVGPGVPTDWLGRRVLALPLVGGYAEYTTCPAARILCPPAEIQDEVVAAAGISYLTAYFMLRHRLGGILGQTVLITAASGTTGTLLAQMARQMGARVLALVSSPAKALLLQACGLSPGEIIDESTEDLQTAVGVRTASGAVDVLIDAVGGPSPASLLPYVTPGGRIVVYGNLAGVPATLDVTRLIGAHHAMLGFSLSTYLARTDCLAEAAVELWRSITNRSIHIPVGRIYPLEQAAAAHASIHARASIGKTLLRVA